MNVADRLALLSPVTDAVLEYVGVPDPSDPLTVTSSVSAERVEVPLRDSIREIVSVAESIDGVPVSDAVSDSV